jgi:hypothetical protein
VAWDCYIPCLASLAQLAAPFVPKARDFVVEQSALVESEELGDSGRNSLVISALISAQLRVVYLAPRDCQIDHANTPGGQERNRSNAILRTKSLHGAMDHGYEKPRRGSDVL